MVEFKKILEFLIYILKIIIYFDTNYVKFQSGGAAEAAVPQAQNALKKAANKATSSAPAPSNSSNSSNSSNNSKGSNSKNSDEKSVTDEAAENAGDAGFLWIFTYIKEIIMGVIKWFGGKIMKLVSMMLFASIAPIIPFFFSMAGMFGVIKYLMYKLRRL